eukprot:scaffold1629_cov369-Prasinococcus_capsulatus_cf.AAC.37
MPPLPPPLPPPLSSACSSWAPSVPPCWVIARSRPPRARTPARAPEHERRCACFCGGRLSSFHGVGDYGMGGALAEHTKATVCRGRAARCRALVSEPVLCDAVRQPGGRGAFVAVLGTAAQRSWRTRNGRASAHASGFMSITRRAHVSAPARTEPDQPPPSPLRREGGSSRSEGRSPIVRASLRCAPRRRRGRDQRCGVALRRRCRATSARPSLTAGGCVARAAGRTASEGGPAPPAHIACTICAPGARPPLAHAHVHVGPTCASTCTRTGPPPVQHVGYRSRGLGGGGWLCSTRFSSRPTAVGGLGSRRRRDEDDEMKTTQKRAGSAPPPPPPSTSPAGSDRGERCRGRMRCGVAARVPPRSARARGRQQGYVCSRGGLHHAHAPVGTAGSCGRSISYIGGLWDTRQTAPVSVQAVGPPPAARAGAG